MSRGFWSRASLGSLARDAWPVPADEGFHLFFPLGALCAALLPLPLFLAPAPTVASSLWHMDQMLVGLCGAALIGFLTTAAPRWTNTEPPRGRTLHLLAALWGIGRIGALFGPDGFAVVGAIADAGWIAALLVYLVRLAQRQRGGHLLGFSFWVAVLFGCVLASHIGFASGALEQARRAFELTGLAFLGGFALVLGRVATRVTNLVLDPSGATSPFRPHPGRLHLAPGLTAVAISGELAGLSPAVSGFLLMAAGAAFMDRVGEAFIGRAAVQTEILMLAGASVFAGAGLILAGCARLGASWSDISGFALAFMGGLGGSVYAVFSIVTRLRTGGAPGQTRSIRFGALALYAAAVLRVAPDFGVAAPDPSQPLSAFLWTGAFLAWLCGFRPALVRIEREGVE